MSLLSAIGIYAGLVIITFGFFATPFSGIVFPLYFISGFVMNRIVLRRCVNWHPVYNTLENVAGSKLRMFLFWPLSYLALFFKLAVMKAL
ncbi:MAG: hypothetical protein GY710_18450 [Desulfobacteraceae bacterium]|nr:hypothetical protein [Desulfobacteraceae bacterium]